MGTFAPCFSLTKTQSSYLTAQSNYYVLMLYFAYFILSRKTRWTQSFDFLLTFFNFVPLCEKNPYSAPFAPLREKFLPYYQK